MSQQSLENRLPLLWEHDMKAGDRHPWWRELERQLLSRYYPPLSSIQALHLLNFQFFRL